MRQGQAAVMVVMAAVATATTVTAVAVTAVAATAVAATAVAAASAAMVATAVAAASVAMVVMVVVTAAAVMAAAAAAGAGAAAGGGSDGGEDGGGDGGGSHGGGGGGCGGSLRQHTRREAVSMCTIGRGRVCVARVQESEHRFRREEVVVDGPKPGPHEESNLTDLRQRRRPGHRSGAEYMGIQGCGQGGSRGPTSTWISTMRSRARPRDGAAGLDLGFELLFPSVRRGAARRPSTAEAAMPLQITFALARPRWR